MRMGDHDIANDYLNESLSIFTSLGEKFKIASVHKELGKLYLIMEKKSKAMKEYRLALNIMKKIGSVFYLEKNRKDIVKSLRKSGLKKEAKELSSL